MLCHSAILSVKDENDALLYSVERVYTDIHAATEETKSNGIIMINHPTYLYKLNEGITPF